MMIAVFRSVKMVLAFELEEICPKMGEMAVMTASVLANESKG
jgi:hypothetical protein